ncbi:MAG: hypothetical protein ACHWZW_17035 [Spirulina sp.]
MQSFSAFSVQLCLVGVAGLTLGSALCADFSALAGNHSPQSDHFQSLLSAQEDDRGSGRLRHRSSAPWVSFRGSGRVDSDRGERPNPPSRTADVAYRGSGRIQPLDPARA